jgi:hypothetical protein
MAQAKSKVEDLQMSLLENGLDFIQSALQNFRVSPDNYELKYGVLHLSSGIELILKERLRHEHWSLVFENVNEASPTVYHSGNFNSVSFETCIKRLTGVCGADLPDAVVQKLRNFRKKRNRFEHFNVVDSVHAIKASAAEALSVLLDFISSEIDTESLEEHQDALDEIRATLREFETFVSKRWNNIKNRVDTAGGSTATCPRCHQQALILDGQAECFFCGHEAEAEMLAEDYAEEILGKSKYAAAKGRDSWPLETCPECGHETLVDREGSDDAADGRYICFRCGWLCDVGDLEYCMRCEAVPVSGGGLCDGCSAYVESQ